MNDDLNKIIEVPSLACGLGGNSLGTYTLKCVHIEQSGCCCHPLYNCTGEGIQDVGCNATNASIMFVRKIDYINWKMTNG